MAILSIEPSLPSSVYSGLVRLRQQQAFLSFINCARSGSLLHYNPSNLPLATRSHQSLILLTIFSIGVGSIVVSAVFPIAVQFVNRLACRDCSDSIEHDGARRGPISRRLVAGRLV